MNSFFKIVAISAACGAPLFASGGGGGGGGSGEDFTGKKDGSVFNSPVQGSGAHSKHPVPCEDVSAYLAVNMIDQACRFAGAFFAYLSWPSFSVEDKSTLTDAALCRRAGELAVAKHVVRLEAEIPLLFGLKIYVSTGSAVCIGEGNEFLSNAHCFAPWCDSVGKFKYPVYIDVADVGKREVLGLKMHHNFMSKSNGGGDACDIAYFVIKESIQSLQGIRPTYSSSADLLGKVLDVIGYGVSGDYDSFWGRCDGHMRAVCVPIDSDGTHGSDKNTITHVCSSLGGYLPDNKIPLIPYQAAFRAGMSGGGAFLNGQYVAIPSKTRRKNSIWKIPYLRFFYGTFFKPLAAAGIPAPFIHPFIGDIEFILLLDQHKKWIEERRAEQVYNSMGQRINFSEHL